MKSKATLIALLFTVSFSISGKAQLAAYISKLSGIHVSVGEWAKSLKELATGQNKDKFETLTAKMSLKVNQLKNTKTRLIKSIEDKQINRKQVNQYITALSANARSLDSTFAEGNRLAAALGGKAITISNEVSSSFSAKDQLLGQLIQGGTDDQLNENKSKELVAKLNEGIKILEMVDTSLHSFGK